MKKDKSFFWIYGIGLFCLVYAIIRYHIFKGVNWGEFPLFIFNKALSLTAILLLAASFLTRIFGQFSKFKISGITFALVAIVLAFIHALISGLILDPQFYPQLFEEGKLNFIGQSSLLLAVLSLVSMLCIGVVTLFKKLDAKIPIEKGFFNFLKYGSLGMAGAHVFFLGFEGWAKPQDWPGYLLPISLISFLAVILTLIYRIVYRKKIQSNPLPLKLKNNGFSNSKLQKEKRLP